MTQAWFLLLVTIVLEVAGTSILKLASMAAGLERLGWFALSLVAYGTCFWLLSLVFRVLPVGVAYAVWSGVGTMLIVLVGMVVFGEALTALKLLFIAMIVIGAVGLNLTSGHGSG